MLQILRLRCPFSHVSSPVFPLLTCLLAVQPGCGNHDQLNFNHASTFTMSSSTTTPNTLSFIVIVFPSIYCPLLILFCSVLCLLAAAGHPLIGKPDCVMPTCLFRRQAGYCASGQCCGSGRCAGLVQQGGVRWAALWQQQQGGRLPQGMGHAATAQL